MDKATDFFADGSTGKLPVCLRLKPKSPENTESDRILSISSTDSNKIILRDNKESTFSRVFDETTTQLELYKEIVFPLVKNTLNGNDSLFFTMGSSGSGKVR